VSIIVVLTIDKRFLAFGVGLDPRQQKLYGPTLGPLLVGISFGVVLFATTGDASGYSGAALNPARCMGIAVASRNFSRQYCSTAFAACIAGSMLTVSLQMSGYGGSVRYVA
jgi:glycerol uptake facilitator-like aquaporin